MKTSQNREKIINVLLHLMPNLIQLVINLKRANVVSQNVKTLQKDIATQLEAMALTRKRNESYSQLYALRIQQQMQLNDQLLGGENSSQKCDAIYQTLSEISEELQDVLKHGASGFYTECSVVKTLKILYESNHNQLLDLNKETLVLIEGLSVCQNEIISQQRQEVVSYSPLWQSHLSNLSQGIYECCKSSNSQQSIMRVMERRIH